MRAAGTGWMRSFRLRLTVTLFAAFVLPAVGFAAWSYERLQGDDARTRGLLVRETLRGVAAAQGSGLDSLSARFDTPLFLFADGVLVCPTSAGAVVAVESATLILAFGLEVPWGWLAGAAGLLKGVVSLGLVLGANKLAHMVGEAGVYKREER